MKKVTLYIVMAIMTMIATVACTDDNVSDLRLSGNCDVTEFAVDNYEGSIDRAAKTITVRVPEVYDLSETTLSALTLSEGAKGNMAVGEKLNLTVPRVLRVSNGDVFLDWTVKAQRDEAKVLSFKLNDAYLGVIDEATGVINVFVPATVDITALIPTMTLSDYATANLTNGVPADFRQPVELVVSNNTAQRTYTVVVTVIGKPEAVYVGLAATQDGLNIEEKTACKWMMENILNSLYASFADIKAGMVDLSECKVIWWHFHKDGGVDGKDRFNLAAPEALDAAVKLKDYYNNGGAFLFTRYATNMPYVLGAVGNEGCPNNCWGQNEAEAETVGGPWSFSALGHINHPLYQGLVMKSDEPNNIYTCDTGYRITNSTAQWHIGSDWGGYADYGVWRAETGGNDLGYGGDGAIVVWEFPANGSRGGILCIGSGCYDWYSVDEVEETYHVNIARMTKNAFNYLMNK